jgi:hypothetical protein
MWAFLKGLLPEDRVDHSYGMTNLRGDRSPAGLHQAQRAEGLAVARRTVNKQKNRLAALKKENAQLRESLRQSERTIGMQNQIIDSGPAFSCHVEEDLILNNEKRKYLRFRVDAIHDVFAALITRGDNPEVSLATWCRVICRTLMDKMEQSMFNHIRAKQLVPGVPRGFDAPATHVVLATIRGRRSDWPIVSEGGVGRLTEPPQFHNNYGAYI